MKDNKHNGNHLGLLLLGIAVGAAMGILFAPAKGRDTRSALGGVLGDLKETCSDKDKPDTSETAANPDDERPV